MGMSQLITSSSILPYVLTKLTVAISDSTEAFDRGDKFADYQQLETLQEYVVINTKRQRVECFRRNNEGLWVLQSYTSEQKSFQLQSINFEAEINLLYEDVVFPILNEN